MGSIDKIVDNIEKVILGKRSEIYQILKGVLSGGHVLLEDVPGVGKTMFVKTLAKSVGLNYNRIQFTPDLLPSDITGVSIYNNKSGEFEFKKGPVFANVILADEINRTSPKTQSALLEVMEENQVSEGNQTYSIKEPFFVIATQNPIEYEGTYRLPEAQLDRFIMKVQLGYADRKDEIDILQLNSLKEPLESIKSVLKGSELVKLQHEVKKVKVSEKISMYITDICRQTRENKYIKLGASTRGALSLQKVAQASAYLQNRKYVTPEDVKENVLYVLCHRMIISESAYANDMKIEEVLNNILKNIQVPSAVYENQN